MSNQQCCSPLDSQLLIKAIHSRLPLWNKTHISHKDIDIIEKLWNEVSVEVNSPKELLKSRWKGLRDTFRKEFKKPGRSKWIHYKNLKFLEDMMISEKNCKTSSNDSTDCKTSEKTADKCNEKEETVPIKEVLSNFENEVDNQSNDEEMNDASANDSETIDVSATVKDEVNSYSEENICNKARNRSVDLERSDSEGGGDNNPKTLLWNSDAKYFNQGIDDDYHFFMSLIPHVKLLPLDQKLVLRMKMQDVIYNEIFSNTDQSSCKDT